MLAGVSLELFWKRPTYSRRSVPVLDHVNSQGSVAQPCVDAVIEEFEMTAHEKLNTEATHFCDVIVESSGSPYLRFVILLVLLTVSTQNYQSPGQVCTQIEADWVD